MVGGIGRAGTRAQEVDFNPTVGERQAEEFSPPGGGLLALPAGAVGEPGLEGQDIRRRQVTGRKQMEAQERIGLGN